MTWLPDLAFVTDSTCPATLGPLSCVRESGHDERGEGGHVYVSESYDGIDRDQDASEDGDE